VADGPTAEVLDIYARMNKNEVPGENLSAVRDQAAAHAAA